jgi:hypothetical protein
MAQLAFPASISCKLDMQRYFGSWGDFTKTREMINGADAMSIALMAKQAVTANRLRRFIEN